MQTCPLRMHSVSAASPSFPLCNPPLEKQIPHFQPAPLSHSLFSRAKPGNTPSIPRTRATRRKSEAIRGFPLVCARQKKKVLPVHRTVACGQPARRSLRGAHTTRPRYRSTRAKRTHAFALAVQADWQLGAACVRVGRSGSSVLTAARRRYYVAFFPPSPSKEHRYQQAGREQVETKCVLALRACMHARTRVSMMRWTVGRIFIFNPSLMKCIVLCAMLRIVLCSAVVCLLQNVDG